MRICASRWGLSLIHICVEVTEERAKTYAFTTAYGYINTALAVRKDNEDIHSFEDLKGKTTANSLRCV